MFGQIIKQKLKDHSEIPFSYYHFKNISNSKCDKNKSKN